ncbi:SIR2 family protein [Rhodovulum kholense]|uniref:SIR2-like protein n=1 Tax=Rhodovulum kholense TaxID=453584 RepID=A0A8E2VG25_9RHOB|nr:SIR2 family protein [Rhodovulum kholense]PTW38811.1 SIR2-like protein [Rhodovulum kholense]
MTAFGDPATQLAFSIHENRGVFALLLGSGLSRAAEIPTGWEITLDLVRRVALAQGVEEQDDWAAWYVEKEGKEPDYSALLAQLASTPAERRAILHSYIEPDEEDREEGRKVPTAGHKAIAKLVRGGYVRVIVTTNFDRLMENALREEGVEPTVVGSPDALEGAEPLTHSACYILKLHGDYKDERILNTDSELEAYPDSYNTLLDRIIDEHGLIVCGWSGEWDHALRAAILRAPNRRYPVFWAFRGELRGRGAELCSARKGVTVPITDADSFFVKLVEQVETLAQSQRQNPLGVDMTVSRAKRYLAKTEYRIQLADLVSEEVERIIARHEQEDLAPRGSVTPEDFQNRVAIYESVSEGLAKVCGLIGRWGDDAQLRTVTDAIKGLLSFASDYQNGITLYLEMQSYPAALAYQACALGLQTAERWQALHEFMGVEVENRRERTKRLLDAVGPSTWEGSDKRYWQLIPEMERRHTPFQDHLVDGAFGKWCGTFLPPRASVSDVSLFAEGLTAIRHLEATEKACLQEALSQLEHVRNYLWAPVGRGGWSYRYHENISKRFDDDEFVTVLAKAGFGRGDTEFIKLAIESYKRLLANLHWY